MFKYKNKWTSSIFDRQIPHDLQRNYTPSTQQRPSTIQTRASTSNLPIRRPDCQWIGWKPSEYQKFKNPISILGPYERNLQNRRKANETTGNSEQPSPPKNEPAGKLFLYQDHEVPIQVNNKFTGSSVNPIHLRPSSVKASSPVTSSRVTPVTRKSYSRNIHHVLFEQSVKTGLRTDSWDLPCYPHPGLTEEKPSDLQQN